MMHSISLWKLARPPNYITNMDREYPYSEVPFLGEYNLIKLPASLNKLIDHVDYWGEGKIVTQHGTSGFSNCYNVNHTYQLVSNGEDRDRKIPNRIPVVTYTNCDTSAYIRDNSVLTVTLMGAPINSSCAADITRMMNRDLGKVVVYGFDSNSKDIQNLTTSLKAKGLYHYPNYKLPGELLGLTLFDDHIAFLNSNELKNTLFKLVTDGEYDAAVTLTKNYDKEGTDLVVADAVQKLLHSNSTVDVKLMSYAYKLWNSGAQDVVRNNFPIPIKLIVAEENVTIVNKGYLQALKLDVGITNDANGDRLAWGDSQDKTSKRVNWRFVPVWLNNEVTFYIYNVDSNMYLKLDNTGNILGDRHAVGSNDAGDERHTYYVEPYIKDRILVFYIINCRYRQGLKLDIDLNSIGDRLLMGHNGYIYKGEEFRWTIESWTNQETKSELPSSVTKPAAEAVLVQR